MTSHDESLFQRLQKARAQHVSALRIALNSAGLREKGAFIPPAPNLGQGGVILQPYIPAPPDAGYDIESLIRAATAIRDALAPFDSSIPRFKEQA